MKEHLFGIFPCLSALRAKRRIVHKICVRDGPIISSKVTKSGEIDLIVKIAKEEKLKIEYRSKEYLDKLVGDRPHQNVVMKVSPLRYESIDDLQLGMNENYGGSSSFWIALDQIQDPMNFGAIIRSAGYLGVDGVIASKKNSCRLSPTVSKASAGAMEWMKIYGANKLPVFLNNLAERGWDVIGSAMPGEKYGNLQTIPCDEMVVNKPSILVLGNEGLGISDEVFRSCNKLTTIPLHSKCDVRSLDSLNVSVATGILLFTLLRHRRKTGSVE